MELRINDQHLKIDPQQGAAISNLSLSTDGQTRELISPQEGYHYQSAVLFPFPNRLKNGVFAFEGNTYQFPLNDFGRPNALHGLLHDQAFELLLKSENELSLICKYQGELPHYPFPFDVTLNYTLTPGSLSIQVEVLNTGKNIMPCAFGWHPYFNLLEDASRVSLQLANVELIEVDEHMIPSGKRTPYRTLEEPVKISDLSLDSCFYSIQKQEKYTTQLTYSDGSVLEVWQDHQHRYTQIYTPDDGKTIAIEPMTGNVNALNNGDGLSLIKPQESLHLNFGVTLS